MWRTSRRANGSSSRRSAPLRYRVVMDFSRVPCRRFRDRGGPARVLESLALGDPRGTGTQRRSFTRPRPRDGRRVPCGGGSLRGEAASQRPPAFATTTTPVGYYGAFVTSTRTATTSRPYCPPRAAMTVRGHVAVNVGDLDRGEALLRGEAARGTRVTRDRLRGGGRANAVNFADAGERSSTSAGSGAAATPPGARMWAFSHARTRAAVDRFHGGRVGGRRGIAAGGTETTRSREPGITPRRPVNDHPRRTPY